MLKVDALLCGSSNLSDGLAMSETTILYHRSQITEAGDEDIQLRTVGVVIPGKPDNGITLQ